MIDVKFLLLPSSAWKHLTYYKQLFIVKRIIYISVTER